MNPVLFEIPGFGPINAYGTLILLGGLVAMPCAYWDIGDRGLAKGRRASMLVDLYLVLVFGAAVGGRVFHVLTAPGSYLAAPSRLFATDGTGFVFFGSLAAIAVGVVWLARRYEAPVASVVDLVATWTPLTHAFGRLGCWFAGCCWGAPSDVGWAVQFDEASVAYQVGEVAHVGAHTVPLHPTQLYESVGLGLCFVVMLAARRHYGADRPWRQASRYALCYGILRTVTEVFRGDASRGYLLEIPVAPVARALGLSPDQPLLLSFSQAVGLALVGLGLWGLRRTRG